ncbi:hypothetical protein B0H66DRAFT_227245 [Apodospora peruviana]|uniref:Zn(2)-C6 fungal-type domain-containing protein n=1 Tax=Apodospora peruviana TaxID=516989 RepID=A0AAE0I5X7_9PEZI|nr:hypothetical protein B0H66DRAFT_227245 [Apodospora peruviana]
MSSDSGRDRTRACVYCNKSKTRCTWPGEPGVGNCHRCGRLGRTCGLPEQRERRRRGPSTRVGQLEQKIDGIMSLLNASRQVQQPSPGSSSSQPSEGSSQTPGLYPVDIGRHPRPPSPLRAGAMLGTLARAMNPFMQIDIIPGFQISLEQAHGLLELYRTSYSPLFPFIPIPEHMSACDLLDDKPFLFRTIMQVVAPQSPAVQRNFSRWFRLYIAEHVVVNLEKRVELLQAIILFVAWGDSHFYIECPVTSLLQIAVGLMADLGLNKVPKIPGHAPETIIDEAKRMKGILRAKAPHTLEDRRAFLACYYVSSLASVLFRHVPSVPFYCGYTEVCCDMLEREMEYESDGSLVALIRMQHVLTRINEVLPNPETDDNNETCGVSLPMRMAMSTIRSELERARSLVPTSIQSKWFFKVAYHGTLVRLYEPAIHMRPSPGGSSDIGERGRRLEALWCCLDAAKAFFDAYASIPAEEGAYLPLSTFSWLSFVVITATRFLFINDSDWNPQVVCKAIDFVGITHQLSELCDQADRVAMTQEAERKRKFIDDNRTVMSMHRDKLRWIGSWCQSKLVPADEPQPPVADIEARELDAVPNFWQQWDLDGEWWQGVMDDSNFGQQQQMRNPTTGLP